MDNMWKIISFSESAVCKGLALGGKEDSTSSHLLRERKKGDFSHRESQLMAQVDVIGIQSWRRECSALNRAWGPSAGWCRWKIAQPWLVGKRLKKTGRRRWGSLPHTKEKCGLLYICRENIQLGYSKPLRQAFSVGHMYLKGWKFIERPRKNLPLFMYKEDTQKCSYTI